MLLIHDLMNCRPKNMQSHRAEIINGINILADMLQSLKDSYSSTSNVLKAIASGRPAQNVMPEVDKSLALLHTSIDTINIVIPLFNAVRDIQPIIHTDNLTLCHRMWSTCWIYPVALLILPRH